MMFDQTIDSFFNKLVWYLSSHITVWLRAEFKECTYVHMYIVYINMCNSKGGTKFSDKNLENVCFLVHNKMTKSLICQFFEFFDLLKTFSLLLHTIQNIFQSRQKNNFNQIIRPSFSSNYLLSVTLML
jgi:hypothetical protein